jgi:acyl dehydratase
VRSVTSSANPVNPFRQRTFRAEVSIGRPFSAFSTTRSLSSSTAISADTYDGDEPFGDLFDAPKGIRPDLIGKIAKIRRTFGPRSNAQAMLTCGGEALAAHASFDPDYVRAQGWIRHHAVGPAVLSPVLVTGVVGALVEATFPHAVPVSQSMKQHRPLIVGVAVHAKIEVVQVVSSNNEHEDGAGKGQANLSPERGEEDRYDRRYGHQVDLKTTVARVRDDVVIAEGEHSIWIPDYLHM